MDYTTLARVKAEMQSKTAVTVQDTLLAMLITEASRMVDRYCTGVGDTSSTDYFKSETVTHTLPGRVDNKGMILSYVHKPVASTVTAFSYRVSPLDAYTVLDPTRVFCYGMRLEAFPVAITDYLCECHLQVSYSGGLATTADTLPEDFQSAVSLLTIRFYREAESGMSDSLGMAEMGVTAYTKAIPIRVQQMLQPYVRQVGWRSIA